MTHIKASISFYFLFIYFLFVYLSICIYSYIYSLIYQLINKYVHLPIYISVYLSILLHRFYALLVSFFRFSNFPEIQEGSVSHRIFSKTVVFCAHVSGRASVFACALTSVFVTISVGLHKDCRSFTFYVHRCIYLCNCVCLCLSSSYVLCLSLYIFLYLFLLSLYLFIPLLPSYPSLPLYPHPLLSLSTSPSFLYLSSSPFFTFTKLVKQQARQVVNVIAILLSSKNQRNYN